MATAGSEVTITVRGSHEVYAPAERGTVHVDVTSQGPEAASVYDEATRAAGLFTDAVRPLHDPDHGPVTWWSSDQLSTWAQRPTNKQGVRLPVVHHARVAFRVKFADFTELSRWLDQVVSIEGVGIDHIVWTLTERHARELTLSVRAAAARDAIDKAQAYADALGLGQVRVIHIADAGMLGLGQRGDWVAQSSTRHATAQSSPRVSFTPEDIEVSVSVDATFVAGG